MWKEGEELATRQACAKVVNAVLDVVPGLVVGAADLTGNTGMKLDDTPAIATHEFGGRGVHYGIREHGMGAVMNGMAVSSLMPAGGTFFVFSDYMRGAVRLAALSQYKSLFVWTHDSVGLGEDGPTHQPIEQLAAMRAMPGLRVIRPADANEVSQAWRVHVDGDGPTALILTRQKLPVLGATADRAPDGVPRGAYTLVDEEGDGLDLVLIGTGSEVSLCVDALDLLDGLSVRVVSMPSWELFALQSDDDREQVLPADVPTLAVEAGATFGWERYADDVIGIDHFGASAPGPVALEKFGFTPEHVAARARALVENGVQLMAGSAIARLNDFGQSPWYDNLARPLLTGGGLAKLVADDGIRGVTSNPTILDKAIGAGEGYDEALAECAKEGQSIEETYWSVVIDDIQHATEVLRPVYDAHGGGDGFVSLEVAPTLAHDTAGTIAAARSLHDRVDRPNLMIKIPATLEGIPAIEETIASGITVNVTLIFSLDRHAKVIEAYLKGLERFVEGGGDPSTIASVASFFVSRVDTETDRRLPEDSPLRGKAAVANAKLAYALFREKFSGPRWDALAAKGARLAAPAVGVDVDQEPGVLADALRRRAHRSRHREHAGAGVDRGAAAGRGQPACEHGHRGRRRRPSGDGRPRRGGRRHRRRDRHPRT